MGQIENRSRPSGKEIHLMTMNEAIESILNGKLTYHLIGLFHDVYAIEIFLCLPYHVQAIAVGCKFFLYLTLILCILFQYCTLSSKAFSGITAPLHLFIKELNAVETEVTRE